MADLVIFGLGDIARLAHFYFTTDSPHRVVAFTVDAAYQNVERFQDLPVVAFDRVTDVYPPSRHQMFIALSYARMNQLRAAKYSEARGLGYTLASYVSSRCTCLTQHPIGDNCFVLEDNTVQPFVRLGSDVTLWSGNHIGHDSVIGDHTFVSSHVVVSGNVTIGTHCFLGVNATLRNGLTIGDGTLVGAGALIMKSTPPGSVWIPERTAKFAKASDQVDL
jgi:sugar O-acyltransferase (sialic acid O-acetyltransferase NeuD family)